MQIKKLRLAILASSLAAVMTIGGVAAYFTDNETHVNTITVGEVKIDVEEPNWDTWKDSDPDPVVPEQPIPKDPTVVNTGKNSAYIFAAVTVPTADIVVANADGTKITHAETQLFSYTPNNNWSLVTSGVTGGSTINVANKTGTYGVHNYNTTTKKGTITYIYAYTGSSAASMEAVAAPTTSTPKPSTTPVFSTVKFVNAIENQSLENSTQDITVKAYAIQSDFVNGGVTAPAAVWQVVQNQNA